MIGSVSSQFAPYSNGGNSPSNGLSSGVGFSDPVIPSDAVTLSSNTEHLSPPPSTHNGLAQSSTLPTVLAVGTGALALAGGIGTLVWLANRKPAALPETKTVQSRPKESSPTTDGALTQDEIHAVHAYTNPMGNFQLSDEHGLPSYDAMNRALRSADSDKMRGVQKGTTLLDSALAKLSSTSTLVTQRGLRLEHIGEIQEGDVYHDPAYISTSLITPESVSSRRTYANGASCRYPADGVAMIIIGRSGVHLKNVLGIGTESEAHGGVGADEQEVLYPRGKKFRVVLKHVFAADDPEFEALARNKSYAIAKNVLVLQEEQMPSISKAEQQHIHDTLRAAIGDKLCKNYRMPERLFTK